MGNGDGAVLGQQQLRHRLADQDRAPDHHRILAGKIAEPVLEQHQRTKRRAGDKAGQAQRKPAGADRGQPVNVLVRADPRDHRLLVEVLRERQLNEDAVDHRVGIQPVDQRQQAILIVVFRQAVFEAGHAALDGRLALGGDIDLARRILAHQHDGEPGLAARALLESGGIFRDAGAQRGGKGFPVDDCGLAHGRWVPM